MIITPVVNNPNNNPLSFCDSLSRKVNTLWLKIAYYLHVLGYCLNFFPRKILFAGSDSVTSSMHCGKKADIPQYISFEEQPREEVQQQRGFRLHGPKDSIAPFGAGLCFGASLHFVKTYLKEGFDRAKTLHEDGVSLEGVVLQGTYAAIRTIQGMNKLAAALQTYIEDPNLDPNSLLSELKLPTDNEIINQLFAHTKEYTLHHRNTSYLEYMNQQTYQFTKTQAHLIEGEIYTTLIKTEALLTKQKPRVLAQKIDEMREQSLIQEAGLKATRLETDISARSLLEKYPTWENGIYELNLPCTTRFGGAFIFSACLLLISLECVIVGQDILFYGISLQEVAGLTLCLSAIGAYISTRTYSFDGQHSVVVIKEEKRWILFDINWGCGTFKEGATLMNNLLNFYVSDLKTEKFSLIDVTRLTLL